MDQNVSRSLTKFATKFCNELDSSRTSVCSPLSAETVLALLALGCRGQARAELLQALDLPDDDAIRSSFANLTSTLKDVKGATISMANKVYLKQGATLKPAMKKDAEEVFGSDLEQLDFNEKETAAALINQWVAKETHGLIKDIVSADLFKDETSLLLINALYFKGQWQVPFEKGMTANRNFHVDKDTIIKVPQMFMRKQNFYYRQSKNLRAKLLRMYYKGHGASMLIVLPDEINGLNKMLQNLAKGYDLMATIKKMKNTELDVMIPKFKAEMTIDLKEVLLKLGIKCIFDKEKSDIDMLSSKQKLFVSDAIQKAFITIDEYGTEAAACTVIHYMLCCARPYPQFIADRPFLYLLMCQEIPLFVGVYRGINE